MLLTFIFPNIVSFPKNVEKSNQPVLFYENWSRFLFYLKFSFLKHKMRSLCNSICSAKKQISQCIFTLNLKWKIYRSSTTHFPHSISACQYFIFRVENAELHHNLNWRTSICCGKRVFLLSFLSFDASNCIATAILTHFQREIWKYWREHASNGLTLLKIYFWAGQLECAFP